MTEQEMEDMEARMNSPELSKDEEPQSAREVLADLVLSRVMPASVRMRLSHGKAIVVVVEVPSAEWVAPIAEAIGELRRPETPMRIICRTKAPKERDEPYLVHRLAKGEPVVGIAPSPDTMLPPVLVKVADQRLVVPPLSADIVVAVMSRCQQGRVPREARSMDFSQLSFDEVTSLIVPDRSVRDTLQRLREVAAKKAKVGERTDRLPRLEDAHEYGPAREWALNLRDDLRDWKKGLIPADAVDRGILLTGEPGVGKTLYARMLGEACGVPTVIASMSDFFASGPGYLDSVIKAQRAAFEEARRQAPSLLFLDEIDQLPNPATISPRGRDWWMPVILDFYQLLDGAMSDRAGVIVIGATNAPVADLAPALLRPGRLERAVHISPPNAEGVVRIMRHHLAGELADVDLTRMGQMNQGRGATGAVIMEQVRAARRRARRAGRPLELEDIEMQIVPPDGRSDEQKWRTAVHEAGHAVLGVLVNSEMVQSTTIFVENGGGGATSLSRGLLPETRAQTYDLVKVLLGGRAAEILVFGEPSHGAGGSADSDLALATRMVAMGFASTGLEDSLVYRASAEEVQGLLNLDPDLRRRVGQVLAMLEKQAEVILGEHRPALVGLARLLLERRFLSASEIAEAAGQFGIRADPNLEQGGR